MASVNEVEEGLNVIGISTAVSAATDRALEVVADTARVQVSRTSAQGVAVRVEASGGVHHGGVRDGRVGAEVGMISMTNSFLSLSEEQAANVKAVKKKAKTAARNIRKREKKKNERAMKKKWENIGDWVSKFVFGDESMAGGKDSMEYWRWLEATMSYEYKHIYQQYGLGHPQYDTAVAAVIATAVNSAAAYCFNNISISDGNCEKREDFGSWAVYGRAGQHPSKND